PEELAGPVAQVIRANLLTFSEEDLPPEGKDHNRALHITVGCEGFYVPHVLINNGSGVNICTLDSAKKIGVKEEDILFKSNTIRTVRGFDNEKINVMGEFTTTISIGPAHTKTTFLVIDINASYTMLLGRPWLHANLAVSSTSHEKLRFIYEDKLITIQGDFEEDEGKGKSSHVTIPTAETDQLMHNYKEKHINQVVHRAPSREMIPRWFEHGHTKVAHYLRKHKFFPGMGLGLRGNGRTEPLDGQQISHEVPYGLGYQPTEQDHLQRELEKSQRGRQGRKSAGIHWNSQPPLNGHFIRKGDSCPYTGFKDPSVMIKLVSEEDVEEMLEGITNLFVEEQEVGTIHADSGKSFSTTSFNSINSVRLMKGQKCPSTIFVEKTNLVVGNDVQKNFVEKSKLFKRAK
ncbi:hypothetical protein MKW94_006632, partial [Papaver nudicaule]|nr:hypothetical protein [Papaver nudicaule]